MKTVKTILALSMLLFGGSATAKVCADLDSNFPNDVSDPPNVQYYAVTNVQTKFDPSKPTRFITGGVAPGFPFLSAAITRAIKYNDADPNDQVILIYPAEDTAKQRQEFNNAGLRIILASTNTLNFSEFTDLLQDFTTIKSWDHFSHSWDYLAYMGDDYLEYYYDFSAVKARLSPDSYVMFFGCNTGWYLMPLLARQLGVPTAGALTSASFEELHSAGNFYYADDSVAPSGPWAWENRVSFSKPRDCVAGGCVRMKSDNIPYAGMHGEYPVGFPTYKFFCPPTMTSDECDRTMASSLIGFADLKPLNKKSSAEDFKTVARDFMCPIHAHDNIREQCIAKLKAVEAGSHDLDTYSPLEGPTAPCTFSECTKEVSAGSTSFIDEYRAYLRGIYLLTSPANRKKQ